MSPYPSLSFLISFSNSRWILNRQKLIMNIADSTMSSASSEEVSCGGAVAGSIFGTIACIIVLAIGAWFLYKKYWKHKSGNERISLLIRFNHLRSVFFLLSTNRQSSSITYFGLSFIDWCQLIETYMSMRWWRLPLLFNRKITCTHRIIKKPNANWIFGFFVLWMERLFIDTRAEKTRYEK